MIKMSAPEELSCFPAVEEGGTGELLDESYTEETSFENTPTISSIVEARKNSPFAAWRPFISSKLFPKLACSALLAILLCATVLLSGASYQGGTTFYNKLVPTNFLNRLFATRRNKRVEAAVLASLLSQDSEPVAK